MKFLCEGVQKLYTDRHTDMTKTSPTPIHGW